MATEDGYFRGRRLAGVDLSDHGAVRRALDEFEAPRKPHTARQSRQAWLLGKLFHHAPPLRYLRDLSRSRTSSAEARCHNARIDDRRHPCIPTLAFSRRTWKHSVEATTAR
jgi:hypothetical protein